MIHQAERVDYTDAMWQSVTIGGKSATLFEPAGGPRYGVIYLHTYNQEALAGNADFTKLFEELKLGCVCPPGGRCWWVDRICAEFDSTVSPERFILQSIAPFLRQRWQLGPRGIALLGIDMGGQGALRLAFKRPNEFPVVAAIAPSIEYHELYWSGTPIDELYASKEECRQDTAPMHIHPTEFPPHMFFATDPLDPWSRGADRLHEKLAALGIAHECDLDTKAGGHTWDYFNAMAPPAVRFLATGLERESRRLV
jgi:S-formylglutathione hydrolase